MALLVAGLATVAAIAAPSRADGQAAKDQKTAAASAEQPRGGGSPLRVGLVISDPVRSYRESYALSHFDYGKRVASQLESVFSQTFASVRSMGDLPSDPNANEGLDLIVVVESIEGNAHQSGLVSGTMNLDVRFTVHDAKGVQLFQLQESDTQKGSNARNMQDRLVEAVSRKFIQDFLVSPRVLALLAPAPRAEPKAEIADLPAMDSSGLEVPPPPPWAQPHAPLPAPAANPAGKP